MTDLLLVHGCVITVDGARRIIDDGAVAIAGDRIAEVGPAAELTRRHENVRRVDCTGRAIIPGLIDGRGNVLGRGGDALVRAPAFIFGPGIIYRLVFGLILFAAMAVTFLVASGIGAKHVDPNEAAVEDDDAPFDEDDDERGSVSLGWIVCGLLMFALIGIPLGALLFLGWLVLTIVAAVKATEGVGYRYPISLRLVK